MKSDEPLKVLPQHLAGEQVVKVIRDRANLIQQYYEHERFAKDPVLSQAKFIKFVVPPQVTPEGRQLPPVQRLITPKEAVDLISMDLSRNQQALHQALDGYVARRPDQTPRLEPTGDPVFPSELLQPTPPTQQLPPMGLQLPVQDVDGETLVQPDTPPEG